MTKDPSPTSAPVLSRRSVFIGAGAIGALGAIAAATAVSKVQPALPAAADAQAARSGGYQLTDHVRQYYATARV